MGRALPEDRRGYRQLTLVVTVTLIAALMGYQLRSVQDLQAQTEPFMVEFVLQRLNAVGMVYFAKAYANNRRPDLKAYVGSNPMHWLEQPPDNYGGEIENAGDHWHKLLAGRWYFATDTGMLHYKVAVPEQLEVAGPRKDQLRFRVELHWNETAQPPAITAVALVPVDSYQWRPVRAGKTPGNPDARAVTGAGAP